MDRVNLIMSKKSLILEYLYNRNGIVDFVDDIGTIHVNWETGSSLGISVGIDEFKILGADEK